VAPNATEINVSSVVPVGGQIDRLYVSLTGAPGTGKGYAFVLYHNGAPTSVGGGAVPATCVATPSAGNCSCFVGGANTTCSDVTTSPVSVAAGDTISISSIPVSTPGSANQQSYGLRWQPTTANQAILMNAGSTVPTTSGTRYMNVSGGYGNAGGELQATEVAPVLTTHMTLGNLIVAQSAAPPASTTRTATLRGGSGSTTAQSPSCAVTPSTTLTIGGVAATPACQDTSDAYQPQSGYLLSEQTAASAAQNALTWYKTAMSVTVP
jgi:hypothetical protein